MFNEPDWLWRVWREEAIQQFDAFQAALVERSLPAFDLEKIQQEADGVSENEWQRLMSLPGDDSFDPASFAEKAEEEGVDYLVIMMDTRQAIINQFTMGLFHLLEQKFLEMIRYLLVGPGKIRDLQEKSPGSFRKGVEALKAKGIDLKNINTYTQTEELEVLANCIKHAEGRSCDDLRTRRPDLFQRPAPFNIQVGRHTPRIFTPLAGQGIFVSSDQFQAYVTAVKDFWEELINILSQASSPRQT